jgi:hypothetical protein
MLKSAAEMGRPRHAAEWLGNHLLGDVSGIAPRVHLLDGRGEDEVGARLLAQPDIPGLIAGIIRVVFAGAELRRVDEDGHDHGVGSFPRQPDQTEVALVQRAHRGHEADQAILGPQVFRGRLHVENGSDHLHGEKAAAARRAQKTGLELSRRRQF